MEQHMEYIGPITELQGKSACVRKPSEKEMSAWLVRLPGAEKLVLAQFDDISLVYMDQNMGYGWHAFVIDHFTPITGKPVF